MIPARDEEGCIAATVEHLHVETAAASVPHEIVVVDDGSTDCDMGTILRTSRRGVPAVRPVQNPGSNGFGRAVITTASTHAAGDAVVDHDGRRIGRLPRRGPLLGDAATKDGMRYSDRGSSRAAA